jgi:hypothetical protein
MEGDASGSLPTPPTTSVPHTPAASQPSSQLPDITPSSSQTTQGAPIPPSPFSSNILVSDAPPPQHDLTIDAVLHRIVALSTAGEYEQLASNLRDLLAREAVFVQSTSSGEDPLRSLDPTVHTLGMLYILCVITYCFELGACSRGAPVRPTVARLYVPPSPDKSNTIPSDPNILGPRV